MMKYDSPLFEWLRLPDEKDIRDTPLKEQKVYFRLLGREPDAAVPVMEYYVVSFDRGQVNTFERHTSNGRVDYLNLDLKCLYGMFGSGLEVDSKFQAAPAELIPEIRDRFPRDHPTIWNRSPRQLYERPDPDYRR